MICVYIVLYIYIYIYHIRLNTIWNIPILLYSSFIFLARQATVAWRTTASDQGGRLPASLPNDRDPSVWARCNRLVQNWSSPCRSIKDRYQGDFEARLGAKNRWKIGYLGEKVALEKDLGSVFHQFGVLALFRIIWPKFIFFIFSKFIEHYSKN